MQTILVIPGDPVSDFRTNRADQYRSHSQTQALLDTLEREKAAYHAMMEAYVAGANWARDQDNDLAAKERDDLSRVIESIFLALNAAILQLTGGLAQSRGSSWE
jgi:hypothetical protein